MKKVYVILLILFLVLVVGYLIIFPQIHRRRVLPSLRATADFSQNTIETLSSTISWKDYNFNGMKFRYPTDWQFKPYNLNGLDAIAMSKQFGSGQKDASFIYIAKIDGSLWGNCQNFLESRKPPEGLPEGQSEYEIGMFEAGHIKGDAVLVVNHFESVGDFKSFYTCFRYNDHDIGIHVTEWGGKEREFFGLPELITILNTIE